MSGLMNKHIVQGQYFIFDALCPSKSGLMNKHIVKPIVRGVSCFTLGALYPSKSGLMNKHIVKHIASNRNISSPSKSGLIHEHIVKQTHRESGPMHKHVVKPETNSALYPSECGLIFQY